ncbi:metal ABC transporter substrate-binding protein [bacterium]|nr:metal ABC transporter substrate-binding protein [bacterium]
MTLVRWIYDATRLLMLMGVVILFGCGRNVPGDNLSKPAEPLLIYVDNFPMEYFTTRIAGPLAKVIFPVPAGRDPAYWKPTTVDIEAIQAADLVVLNGADYSNWSKKITLAPSKVIDASRPFKGRFLYPEDAIVHSHGPEGEHSHAGLASFTWLDFDQAIEQSKTIAEGITKQRPDRQTEIESRRLALEVDLTKLRDRFQKMVAHRSEPLLASHPVYDYLARHGGWNLKSVHWEPDEVPAEEGWKELSDLLTTHAARWMIWEGPPRDETAQRLTALGIQTVVFDPLAGRPEGEPIDFLSAMNQNLDQLERIYRYEPDGSPPAR